MSATSRTFQSLKDGNPITGKEIADLITEAKPRHIEQLSLYERYKGSKTGVPIFTRTYPIADTSKVNNKIANDFFSDIVDTKTGYMAGQPITYEYDDESVSETIRGFIKRNSIPDLDSESIKMAAIAGYSARYCYIDTDGEIGIINVPPWECIFICDELGITDAEYAIRYYPIEINGEKYTKAEFMDEAGISYWIRKEDVYNKDGESFILDPTETPNPLPHLLGGCPLICFPNNEELQGDCEKALSLIDGYDRTLSDINSEIEQFRLAYLALYGINASDETLKLMRQTGAISIPDTAAKAEFITKNLNDVIVENHLNRLESNIYMFTKSVKISDEQFAANASGVAMKYKLFGLESKCITTERKFTKALYRMFEVLAGYFDKRGVSFDPWEFSFVWVRNFPLDLMAEAQATVQLKGMVSEETRLSQLTFVNNVEEEMAKMKQDTEDMIDLDKIMFPQQDQQNPDQMMATSSS